VGKEIWRTTAEQARRILAEEGIELTGEEVQVLLEFASLS